MKTRILKAVKRDRKGPTKNIHFNSLTYNSDKEFSHERKKNPFFWQKKKIFRHSKTSVANSQGNFFSYSRYFKAARNAHLSFLFFESPKFRKKTFSTRISFIEGQTLSEAEKKRGTIIPFPRFSLSVRPTDKINGRDEKKVKTMMMK